MRNAVRVLLAVAGAALIGYGSSAAAQAGRRVALVVGAADYRFAPPLPNADRDANALGHALENLGFEVARAINPDLAALRSAVAAFHRAAADADGAFVFYAGHAFRHRGVAYLAPVDAGLRDEAGLEWETLQLAQTMGAATRARSAVIVLDGCGGERLAATLERLTGAAAGVGDAPARNEALVAVVSARKGEACDRAARGDVFVNSLLAELGRPGADARDVFDHVRDVVSLRTGGRLRVDVATGLVRPFVLARDDTAPASYQQLGADPAMSDLRAFIDRFGEHPLASIARTMLLEKEVAAQRAGATRSAQDPWRGQIGERWNGERREKGRWARQSALEARWSREQGDRQEEETKARIARDLELARQVQAEIAAEEARRRVEIAAAEQRRQEVERAERERQAREEEARRARTREEDERRRQTELAFQAEEARRAAAPRVAMAPPAPQPSAFDAAQTPHVVPVGGRAVEEASRFSAEQRRLAQERIDRERRERRLVDPEFAEPLPSEAAQAPDAEPAAIQVAAAPAAARPLADPNFRADAPETIRAAQTELKRLGCYDGAAHGRLNAATKSGVAAAAAKLGPTAGLQPLSEAGLRNLREWRGALCGPAVARRP